MPSPLIYTPSSISSGTYSIDFCNLVPRPTVTSIFANFGFLVSNAVYLVVRYQENKNQQV